MCAANSATLSKWPSSLQQGMFYHLSTVGKYLVSLQMDSLLGMFGFNPVDHDTAARHYEDIYLSQQPKHEGSLTHEGWSSVLHIHE